MGKNSCEGDENWNRLLRGSVSAPIAGRVQGKVRGFEHPGLVTHNPAHGRGVGMEMILKGPRSFYMIPRWLCRNWITSAVDGLKCLCSSCKLALVSLSSSLSSWDCKARLRENYYFETDKMY